MYQDPFFSFPTVPAVVRSTGRDPSATGVDAVQVRISAWWRSRGRCQFGRFWPLSVRELAAAGGPGHYSVAELSGDGAEARVLARRSSFWTAIAG
jgi:hypothetical protein